MSDTVRVFVNGVGLDAPTNGSALDAVEIHSPADAIEVRRGSLLVTDSRGLPVSAESPLFNGALFRLIPHRTRDGADPASPFDS